MYVVTTYISIANYIWYINEYLRSLTVIFHSGVTREDHQINTPFPMDMTKEGSPSVIKNKYDIEISAIEFRCVCTMMIAFDDILVLLIALKIDSPVSYK